MKNRLEVARELLRDDGVIFISIDDNEIHYLKVLCDEIFGRENFVATIPRKTRSGKSDVPYQLSQDFDFMLVYSKNGDKTIPLFRRKIKRKYHNSPDFPDDEWRLNPLTTHRTVKERPNSDFTIVNPKNGEEFPVNPNRCWAVTKDTFPEYLKQNKIVFPGDYEFLSITKPYLRIFKSEDIKKKGENWNTSYVSSDILNQAIDKFAKEYPNKEGTEEIIDHFGSKVFSFPKPVAMIQKIIEITTRDNDLILDFFAGSGTTGEAVLKQNQTDSHHRRFILIEQLEEHIKICQERLEKVVETCGIDDQITYFELAKFNQKAKELINNCSSFKELINLFTELYDKYFLHYRLKTREFKDLIIAPEFQSLPLSEQKQRFMAILDLNQLYINRSEMRDSKYNLSPISQQLTDQFYSQNDEPRFTV